MVSVTTLKCVTLVHSHCFSVEVLNLPKYIRINLASSLITRTFVSINLDTVIICVFREIQFIRDHRIQAARSGQFICSTTCWFYPFRGAPNNPKIRRHVAFHSYLYVQSTRMTC